MNRINQASNAIAGIKTVVKAKEMDDDMFFQIEKMARDTFDPKEKFRDEMVFIINNFKEVANNIKDRLEEKYGSKDLCWHVIVGRHFGGFLTHQEKIYTYFYIAQIGFLIFATVTKFIYL